MFCHYMLSSGGLVGRFCPMVQLASATHLSAGGSLSRLRFASELVVSSRVPKCLHRMAVLAPKTGVKKEGVEPGRFHWPLLCCPTLIGRGSSDFWNQVV